MKITNHLKMSLAVIGVLAITSCQPSGSADGAVGISDSVSGLTNCQANGTSLENAEIQGADSLVSGQSAELSLGSSVDCAQAEKATWTASGVVLGQGSSVSAKIKGTGIYVIQVSSSKSIVDGAYSKIQEETAVTTSVRVGVTNSDVLVVGPQIGTEFNLYEFSLAIPNTIQLQSAQWNFNDGTAVVSSVGPVSHSFMVGEHNLVVTTVDSNNQTTVLNHHITILPLTSGIDCPIENLDIVGPTEVSIEARSTFSLSELSCLAYEGTQISWNFGDGTPVATTSTVNHTYDLPGNYTITVTVRLGALDSNTITLTRQVRAVDYLEDIPGPVEPPPPVDPNVCAEVGETRLLDGTTNTQTVACGVNGSRENVYREQITQTCQASADSLVWVETSRSQVLVSEGECLHQSCQVSTAEGSQSLSDGQSIVLYSSSQPVGSCDSVKETITCNNGIISGSTTATQTSCQNGCGEFGPNGTVQVGVVTGSVSLPVTCQYGEEGITNTVQLVDQSCVNGSVISSNSRLGDVILAGQCPVYSNTPTDNWGACSADCGGSQTRIYECRDSSGNIAPADRCGAAPIETRLCDGNPEAVRSSSSTTTEEEIGSSAVCPKNQIGVITKERTVTTTVTLACIDHKVQEESRVITATEWVTNTYCRNLVTSRCSHDSLSNAHAAGRFDWMVKCQDQNPLIKEFLVNFEDTSYKNIGLNNTSRHLYPTFMNSKSKKPWIAPINVNASCNVPATVYIAAVCVSSCATPEQTIIAKAKHDRNLAPVKFIDALTQEMPWVGTLQSNSIMSSKSVQKTAVDKWVTELVDTTQPILIFKMKSGGELKVTPNHAVLHESGMMKMASEFKVGDNLLQLGARRDPIVSIVNEEYFGKVYNVFVKSNDLKKNVVFLNGYMAGTAFYQNEGTQELNRDLFKNRLIRGVLEKK